jgi:hypothetical protein
LGSDRACPDGLRVRAWIRGGIGVQAGPGAFGKLSARVRVLSVGHGRKNDELDATFTALAAWRNGRLARVRPDEETDVLRLLSERREDLVSERTRILKAACTDSCGTSSLVASRVCSPPTGPRIAWRPPSPQLALLGRRFGAASDGLRVGA